MSDNIKINLNDFPEFQDNSLEAEEAFIAGDFFRKTKEFRDAVSKYTEAIELGYKDPMVYGYRAICNGILKDYKSAFSDIDIALSKLSESDNEQKALLLEVRSRLYFTTDDKDNFLRDLEKSCELYPTEALGKLGKYYYQIGEFGKSIKPLQAMFIGFDNKETYAFLLSRSYIKLNDKELALKYAEIAKKGGYDKSKYLFEVIDKMK